MKKEIKMSKKEIILLIILIILLGINFGGYIKEKGWLSSTEIIGISNGSPYLLESYNIRTNLIKPKNGDLICYYNKHYETVCHKLIDETNNYYVAIGYDGKGSWVRDYVPKGWYIGTIIFYLPLKTTNDIEIACEKEKEVFDLNWDCSTFIPE